MVASLRHYCFMYSAAEHPCSVRRGQSVVLTVWIESSRFPSSSSTLCRGNGISAQSRPPMVAAGLTALDWRRRGRLGGAGSVEFRSGRQCRVVESAIFESRYVAFKGRVCHVIESIQTSDCVGSISLWVIQWVIWRVCRVYQVRRVHLKESSSLSSWSSR